MGLIQEALDEWFTKRHEERPPDGFLHPSSLSGCPRSAVYEASGTLRTDERSVRSMRIMLMGTEVHSIIQEALMASGLPGVECEVDIEDEEFRVVGSADVVWMHAPDKYEVVEIKSISPFALKRKGLPQPQHVEQARIYMWALRRGPDARDVTRVRIVYVTRDDLEIRAEHEYIIAHDPEWDERFEARTRLWSAMLGTDLLPPRIPADGDMAWLCGYCSWKTRCWQVDSDKRRVATVDDREDV